MAAAALEHVGDGEIGPRLEKPGAGPRRRLPRAAQRGHGVLTSVRPEGSQRHHRFSLVLPVAELPGEGQQVPGQPFGFLITVLPHQRPAEPGQDLGSHPARRARQAQRRPQVIELPGKQQFLPEPGATPQHRSQPFGIT